MGNEIAKQLLEIFGTRSDVYAVANYDGARVGYRTIRGELSEEIIEKHLAGEETLGTYSLSPDSKVRWLGWDVDSVDAEEARRMALAIRDQLQGLPLAVEVSGGKGYHLLLFLEQSLEAARAKEFSEAIRSVAGLPAAGASHCECYPKQAAITANAPFGSLLKLPLGLHPKTRERSRFIDPDAGWEEIPPLPVLLTRVSDLQLAIVVPLASLEDRIVEIMHPHWSGGQRHSVALALSGMLSTLGWRVEDAESVVRKLCERAGDTEVENRLQAVQDTFQRSSGGQPVAGYSVLVEILSGPAMHALLELASVQAEEAGVRRIDEIRMRRELAHVKVRLAESTIFADTCSSGLWVRSGDGTEGNTLYYLDGYTHKLYQATHQPGFDSTLMQFLHRKFGLNITDSFGKQTYSGLLLRAIDKADKVQVHRRSHWDGQKLFICLGGSEVYVLNGQQTELSYNGECGHIFETSTDTVPRISLSKDPTGVGWKILVGDLNLTSSTNAPATPEQQKALLWAWTLNTFYPSISATKPLLLALGATHSGKTTTMRRLIRVLENRNSEVLELSTDKQDSLRASFASHHILVIDNLEKSGTKWLADMLNRVATGSAIELRELYRTNSVYRVKPECFVALTAVTLPFSEETIYNRMLVLEFQQLRKMVPEHLMQARLLDNYEDIWLDLFSDLNKVSRVLQNGYHNLQTESSTRLADFELFCSVLQQADIHATDLAGGLKAIPKQQQKALAENSPFVTALQVWVESSPNEAIEPHSAGELLNVLQPVAKMLKDERWIWTTPHGLSRHLEVLETKLIESFGCEICEMYDTLQGRSIRKYMFRRN